jgi:2-dehydro-3-deoxyphosphogalactonate aldolase
MVSPNVLGPSGIAAIRAVLPKDAVIGAVGGVSDKNFADYIAVGIQAFGLGSSLYKPGMSVADVKATAQASVAAYDRAVS